VKILAIFFILTFCTNTFSAELPPRWRFEYSYGKVKTFYLEEQTSILFTRANVNQISDFHQFVYQYYLVPPWIDISIGANTTGTQVEEPEEQADQFRYITAYANIGFIIPISDFWHIKLIAENFYTSMQVKDDAFGFQNLRGNQIYPEFEWLPFGSDMFLQVTPYFKVPLWSDVGGRKETTIGLKFKIPLNGKRVMFPSFAYQKAIMLKVFFTNMHLNFEKEGFIASDIDVRQVGASVGFNF
jgi:hypothetical protein